MRRLCHREWNWLCNWRCVNQHSWDPWQRTTWSRRVTSDFNSVYRNYTSHTTSGGSRRGAIYIFLLLLLIILFNVYGIIILQNKGQITLEFLKRYTFWDVQMHFNTIYLRKYLVGPWSYHNYDYYQNVYINHIKTRIYWMGILHMHGYILRIFFT